VNKRKRVLTSTAISLALHIVFLIAAFRLLVSGFAYSPHETGSLVRVKILDSKELLSSLGDARKLHEQALPQTPELGAPAPDSMEKAVELAPQRPPESAPEIQEMAASFEKSPVQVVQEQGAGPAPQAPAQERNVKSRLIASEDVLKELSVSSSQSLNQEESVPASSNYGVVVSDAGAGALNGAAESVEEGLQTSKEHNLRVPFERLAGLKDIKSFLAYELLTYEDSLDHGKYFKLSIRVEEAPVTLPSIPKEIVFLVDASNSIGKDRLELFKKGLQECLNQLGLNDKFNVMVFKKSVVKFVEKSIERNPDNITNAVDFLHGFEVGSKTDVYDAVLKSIDLQDPMKPAYILLLSDGQATEGVTNPQQIINQITRGNKGRVPVFAFGGGTFVDEYLLEFLSFTNRGWAEFSPRDHQVAKRTIEMYHHIKDPVLLDLRYYVSGIEEKEMYPKLLPDFFRGSKFVLYGRYTDEQAFYLQLLGDSQGESKEFLITDDISQAPRGDKTIARDWAFRKVYHLVGLLEYDKDNPELIRQIKELTRKFNLQTPYVAKSKK